MTEIHEFSDDRYLLTGDTFLLAADLVAVPSVSFNEARITDLIEESLHDNGGHLDVFRIGDNLVARTDLGRQWRLILAGHTDTVPPSSNAEARIEGDVLWGVGSADMKGGLAVMLELALNSRRPIVDVTYIFYAREEVDSVHSGLREVAEARPDLLAGDVALLLEPTGGIVEAGCQGTMRVEVTLDGERAHTARGWMGRNAIHRIGPVLAVVEGYEPRRPVISGCEFREGLQCVRVAGGVAGNVVPDEAVLTINHRFAPDRTPEQAEAHVRSLVEPVMESGDRLEVVDAAPPADPGLDHPLLKAVVRNSGAPPRAKLGWTDAAFFAARGVPASNFGPGDPLLAHTSHERVHRDSLHGVYRVLEDLLIDGTLPQGSRDCPEWDDDIPKRLPDL